MGNVDDEEVDESFKTENSNEVDDNDSMDNNKDDFEAFWHFFVFL